MYVTYDSPPQSYLFDLVNDPNATHSVPIEEARAKYEQCLLEYLQTIADFYGYRPKWQPICGGLALSAPPCPFRCRFRPFF